MKNLNYYTKKIVELKREKLLLKVVKHHLKNNHITRKPYVCLKNILKKSSSNHIVLMHKNGSKLFSLGFHEKGCFDLLDSINNEKNKYIKAQAAWTLALWHANKSTRNDYEKCLEFLEVINYKNIRRVLAKQMAIIEAEALIASGRTEEAKKNLSVQLKKGANIDLYLALANTEKEIATKVEIINKGLSINNISPIKIAVENNKIKIAVGLPNKVKEENHKENTKKPLVSIIMPAYNSETTIENSITSLLDQTWENIEIIVVDDASTDNTTLVTEKLAKSDSRIKIIKCTLNQGAYVARNIGLQNAVGEFVTCHDTDDWSHPQKIELQVKALIKNPHLFGIMSQLTRITKELNFYRRGNPGFYVQRDFSSLMVRTQLFKIKFGNWDSVRFGADGELINRIKQLLGKDSIIELKKGPLSFALHNEASLTGSSSFGYHGYLMGARLEYFDAAKDYYQKGGELKYDFPMAKRPFQAPYPMLPNRTDSKIKQRNFDVIIASDFRLPGRTTHSNIEEIKAQSQFNLKTGIVQINRYDIARRTINPKVRKLIDLGAAQIIVYGEEVNCNLLIIRHPPVLQYWQKYLPKINAKNIVVIANQTPYSEYGAKGKKVFCINDCASNLKKYFNTDAVWYPIGPLVRKKMLLEMELQDTKTNMSESDWVNIVNTAELQKLNKNGTIREFTIGRHGRDHYTKWPDNNTTLKKAYPIEGNINVKILGGAETPLKMIGRTPLNWTIYPFDSICVVDFLNEIDVFVYYHHPDLTEAFGRTIIEAMAAGVPVILQEHFKPLFKEAALYATEDEVMDYVLKLRDNKEYYNERREIGLNFVEQNFGYTKHLERIKPFVTALQ